MSIIGDFLDALKMARDSMRAPTAMPNEQLPQAAIDLAHGADQPGMSVLNDGRSFLKISDGLLKASTSAKRAREILEQHYNEELSRTLSRVRTLQPPTPYAIPQDIFDQKGIWARDPQQDADLLKIQAAKMDAFNAMLRKHEARMVKAMSVPPVLRRIDIPAMPSYNPPNPFVDDVQLYKDEITKALGLRQTVEKVALPTDPDPSQPDTLGWRAWILDPKSERLMSPHYHTAWDGPELRVEKWDESAALRGVSGIHAKRMPLGGWLALDWPKNGHHQEIPMDARWDLVTGIVERFGKFVLGKLGWRAEWVIIRELRTTNFLVAKHLRQVYPEVKVNLVHTMDKQA